MNSVHGIPGLNTTNFSNATALRQLKKPPMLRNPLAGVEMMPVNADVAGMQQVKVADRERGVRRPESPAFPDDIRKNIEPAGTPSAAYMNAFNSPNLDRARYQAAAGDLSNLKPIPYSENAARENLEQALTAGARGDLRITPPAAAAGGYGYLPTVAGAGLGALLGNLVYGGTRDKDDEGTMTGAALSSLAGAGLGGGLGYLAGNPDVQQAISAAMKEVTGAAVRLPQKRRTSRNSAEKIADAEDIVDTSSTSGLIKDLVPSFWGGERAGRAQAMATAAGERTPFSVRHPFTDSTLRALVGSLGGGVAGAALGGLGGAALTYLPMFSKLRQFDPMGLARVGAGAGAGLGVGLGAGVGGLLGHVHSTLNRRNEFSEINKAYDAARAAGTLNPEDPKFSLLSAALLPLRGPHRMGQRDAVGAIRNADKLDRSVANDAGYLASLIAGLPIGGYTQNIVTQFDKPKPLTVDGQVKKKPGKKAKSDDTAEEKYAVDVLVRQLTKAANEMKWRRVFSKLAKTRQHAAEKRALSLALNNLSRDAYLRREKLRS